MDLNKVQLIGRITADPEIRETPNGTRVANFSVATGEKYKDNSGQEVSKTEFTNIVLWAKLAEIAEQYVKKGDKLYIEGKLQTRSWEDQNGVKKYKTEVIGSNMIMLGSPKGNSEQSEEYAAKKEEKKAAEKQMQDNMDSFGEQPKESVEEYKARK